MKNEIQLIHGDCLERLKELPDNSVDSVVTDPPYGLCFMGKKWDYDVPSEDVWSECLRVLKPGGHLLAFAGTRTQHRMAARIEDAGFEIRDMIAWVYGSGFPKSLDVSKAIDKAAGAEREKVPATGGLHKNRNLNDDGWSKIGEVEPTMDSASPATDAARQWQGWGTALKPALEPITLARKPLAERTVAANVLEWGTGGVNVDGCRVGTKDLLSFGSRNLGDGIKYGKCKPTTEGVQNALGRFPANFIHDGSEETIELMGSAARFFYCAKASKLDRDEGCEFFEAKNNMRVNGPRENEEAKHSTMRANHHPTVKPTNLMRYLCRLVTPPHGIVLDPFMGSGSTGKAASLEGFKFIGIERESEYMEIAKSRIEAAKKVPQ